MVAFEHGLGWVILAALIVGYWDNIKNHVDKWTRPPVAPDALLAQLGEELLLLRDTPAEQIVVIPGSKAALDSSRRSASNIATPSPMLSNVTRSSA